MDNLSYSLDLVFGALADPTRRAVLKRLGEGEASIGELAQPFEMSLPSLMKHVRVLEGVGLVESTKRGRVRTCRLKPAAMTDAERWLAEQRAIWETRLDRLELYVQAIQKKSRKKRLKRLRSASGGSSLTPPRTPGVRKRH